MSFLALSSNPGIFIIFVNYNSHIITKSLNFLNIVHIIYLGLV